MTNVLLFLSFFTMMNPRSTYNSLVAGVVSSAMLLSMHGLICPTAPLEACPNQLLVFLPVSSQFH